MGAIYFLLYVTIMLLGGFCIAAMLTAVLL